MIVEEPSPSATVFLQRQYLACGGDSIFAFDHDAAKRGKNFNAVRR